MRFFTGVHQYSGEIYTTLDSGERRRLCERRGRHIGETLLEIKGGVGRYRCGLCGETYTRTETEDILSFSY